MGLTSSGSVTVNRKLPARTSSLQPFSQHVIATRDVPLAGFSEGPDLFGCEVRAKPDRTSHVAIAALIEGFVDADLDDGVGDDAQDRVSLIVYCPSVIATRQCSPRSGSHPQVQASRATGSGRIRLLRWSLLGVVLRQTQLGQWLTRCPCGGGGVLLLRVDHHEHVRVNLGRPGADKVTDSRRPASG
jgi:hypothetical protein